MPELRLPVCYNNTEMREVATIYHRTLFEVIQRCFKFILFVRLRIKKIAVLQPPLRESPLVLISYHQK